MLSRLLGEQSIDLSIDQVLSQDKRLWPREGNRSALAHTAQQDGHVLLVVLEMLIRRAAE